MRLLGDPRRPPTSRAVWMRARPTEWRSVTEALGLSGQRERRVFFTADRCQHHFSGEPRDLHDRLVSVLGKADAFCSGRFHDVPTAASQRGPRSQTQRLHESRETTLFAEAVGCCAAEDLGLGERSDARGCMPQQELVVGIIPRVGRPPSEVVDHLVASTERGRICVDHESSWVRRSQSQLVGRSHDTLAYLGPEVQMPAPGSSTQEKSCGEIGVVPGASAMGEGNERFRRDAAKHLRVRELTNRLRAQLIMVVQARRSSFSEQSLAQVRATDLV